MRSALVKWGKLWYSRREGRESAGIPREEVRSVGTEKERKDTQQAVLYELRRLLKNSGKESYTVEELCDLLDTIADAKAQE